MGLLARTFAHLVTRGAYGIAWPNNHRVVGSLASCKKLVRQWLELAERKAAAAAA